MKPRSACLAGLGLLWAVGVAQATALQPADRPLDLSPSHPESFEVWSTSTATPAAGGDTLNRPAAKSASVQAADPALAQVPEPESYVLMLAGVAAIGFVALRRRE